MPKENTKFPEPLSINRPTKGAKIAATISDNVYAPVSEVLEKPNWVSQIAVSYTHLTLPTTNSV